MTHPFQSIRWRLLLWHSLISLGLVIAIGMLANRLSSRDRMERIDRDLRNHERAFFFGVFMPAPGEKDEGPPTLDEIRERLRSLGDPAEDPPVFRDLFKSDPAGTYIVVWDSDGSPLFTSPNAPDGLTKPEVPEGDRTTVADRGSHRERHRRHPSGMVTVIGRDISAELGALYRFRVLLGLGGAAILLAALAGGWWLAGRALRPIGTISRTASRIADGKLEERIAISGRDSELDQLAHVLNDTFEQLASAIEQQQRFTADASHELRTPLTILLTETQRALKGEREPEQYRQFLRHCQTAAQRMRGIVDSLLLLARHDIAGTEPAGTRCDLAQLSAQLAERMAPIAEDRNTSIRRDLQPAPVNGRPDYLETLLQNLLANALAHPPEGTPVTLRSFARGPEAVVEVHDEGPGIPEEHLPRLFDRFYRADPARSQGAGHSGLGLAIARSIARALGGRLEVESSPGTGTTFRVALPLASGGSPP